MCNQDMKVAKINDSRLDGYVNRVRSGSTQIFYKGTDYRDRQRWMREGGPSGNAVKMHDKPDTIRIEPPEIHYYAELVDGEWWWLNGCAACNGRGRRIACYMECLEHNVCVTCHTPRAEVSGPAYGADGGWRCEPCQKRLEAERRAKALAEFDEENYSSWDYMDLDSVKCPYCGSDVDYEYGGDNSPPPEECPTCNHTFGIEIELRPVYTTKRIKPKQKEDL